MPSLQRNAIARLVSSTSRFVHVSGVKGIAGSRWILWNVKKIAGQLRFNAARNSSFHFPGTEPIAPEAPEMLGLISVPR